MRRLLAVLLLALVAGCNHPNDNLGAEPGSTGEPNLTETSSPTNGPSCVTSCVTANSTGSHRLQLLECVTYFLFYPVDETKVAAEMQAEYEPVFDTPTAGLDAFVCKSAVIDNTTVEQDVQWFAASIVTNPPEEVDRQDAVDIYHFEVCINKQSVAEVFRRAGFIVCNGEVRRNSVPGVDIDFLQDGQITYHFTGAGEEGSNPERTASVRIHQGVTNRAWFDEDSKVQNPGVGQVGVLEVTGGAIARVVATPGRASAAHSGIGTGTYILDFPKST
jgi:hypothetical protein